MKYVVNQLGKHDLFYYRVSNLEYRKRFSDQMNKNHVDLILSRQD